MRPVGHVLTVLDINMCFSLQVERCGEPTWRRLAEAVEHHGGGNSLAAAQAIAREHPGVLP